MVCIKCGKEMVRRVRKIDGVPFLGCEGFPTCRNTQSLTFRRGRFGDRFVRHEIVDSPDWDDLEMPEPYEGSPWGD